MFSSELFGKLREDAWSNGKDAWSDGKNAWSDGTGGGGEAMAGMPDMAAENSNDPMANDSTSPIGGKIDELDLFKRKPKSTKPAPDIDDYRKYFATPNNKEQVYHKPAEYYDKTNIDPLATKMKEARKKKAVPGNERDPGALATRQHIVSQERRHREWDDRQADFYRRYPEYAPKNTVAEDAYPALLKRMIGAHGATINRHGVEAVTEAVKLVADTMGPVAMSEALITDLAREVHYNLTHETTILEVKQRLDAKCRKGKHKEGTKIKGDTRVNNCVPNEAIENKSFAKLKSLGLTTGKNRFKSLRETNVEETSAWQKSSGKNKNGGLNKKGVDSYRKEHPGSKLKTAVTKKPSEIKKGSKDDSRRKSFCARMSGMKKHNTSSKTANDPDSRINKSLRKWHCESVEEGRVLASQYVNLFMQLRRPGAKPILIGKHIPSKAIDALIDKISSKYSNVQPDMFVWEPSNKEQ
jgi:hypothetical protein